MTVVAAFDVDGTLTTRDCVVPFLRRIRGTAPLVGRLALRSPALAVGLARRDRNALKAIGTSAGFGGLAVDEVRRSGATFATHVARDRMRSDTLDRLHWHRGQGHLVVLVSASFEVYLEPLAARIGADVVLGTRLGVDPEGRFTGALDGPNCRGPEKVRRLHAWLGEHHGGRSAVEIYAYGDSAGDRELLADADHPVWANEAVSSEVPR